MSRATDLLDTFYAESLGCRPEDLGAGRMVVVESDMHAIRFAKGSPLALYALARPGGAVITAPPGCGPDVERAVRGARVLDDTACDSIERVISALVSVRFWFRGLRLYCEAGSFVDRSQGEVRELLPDDDQRAFQLQGQWGGNVFGQIVDGMVASRAVVKPLSEVVWDLSIETLPAYRGRGYAKSAVSAALKHVFANDRLAGWGCDRSGVASVRIAESVGFQHYALDFGCVERSLEGGPVYAG